MKWWWIRNEKTGRGYLGDGQMWSALIINRRLHERQRKNFLLKQFLENSNKEVKMENTIDVSELENIYSTNGFWIGRIGGVEFQAFF